MTPRLIHGSRNCHCQRYRCRRWCWSAIRRPQVIAALVVLILAVGIVEDLHIHRWETRPTTALPRLTRLDRRRL
jgi:hypothetical protein